MERTRQISADDHPHFFRAHDVILLRRIPPFILSVSFGSRTGHGSMTGDRGSCDATDPRDDMSGPSSYLALARGALVVRVLPGAAAVVDDAGVAARPGTTRNRERGAVDRHLASAGIVLAARATIALLGHGIRAGHRWTLHLPAIYFAVLQ